MIGKIKEEISDALQLFTAAELVKIAKIHRHTAVKILNEPKRVSLELLISVLIMCEVAFGYKNDRLMLIIGELKDETVSNSKER